MYESFFGFKEKPFNITPDPRFLYLSEKHKEALAQLIYGVKERKGFVVLSGEVGTGKTTVVRALLEQLDRSCQVAYILNPKLSVTAFLKYACHDFALRVKGRSKVDYLMKLQDFLIESHKDGKTVILIVDEAQNLDATLFEEIRMLTNLETSSQKLLQVFLVGQRQLNDLLEQSELWQLKQRISKRYHLLPLDQRETKEYIQTRMKIAGAESLDCFSEGAVEKIYECSRGVPRLINNICDNSLLIGYAMDRRTIDTKIVEETVAELNLDRIHVEDEAYAQKESVTSVGHRTSYASLVILLILITLALSGAAYFLVGERALSKPFEAIRSFFQTEQKMEGIDRVSTEQETTTNRRGEPAR